MPPRSMYQCTEVKLMISSNPLSFRTIKVPWAMLGCQTHFKRSAWISIYPKDKRKTHKDDISLSQEETEYLHSKR